MRTASWERRGRSALLGIALSLWLAVVPGSTGFQEGADAYQRRDYATALRAWLPLAQQGHATAQFNLGVLYGQGQGVPQDHLQAYLWFTLVADGLPAGTAHEQAVRNRHVAAARLTPTQLVAAQALAQTWQPPSETPTAGAPDLPARPQWAFRMG